MDKLNELAWLKAQLVATDYTVIKVAEGEATKEQYADVTEQRRQWRERIKELENE